MLNLKTDFGAIGDGIADDSTAVQNALTYFTTHNGELYAPQGTYRVTRTMQYTGNVSGGIHIVGDIGGTRGPGGTLFLYDGPVMQNAVFYLLGMNGSLIENIEVQCQNKALYGIWLDATNTTPGGSAPSSGNVLRRVTVGNPTGTDCAAIAFGHSVQTQVSEVAMYDLVLLSGAGTGAGIKTYNTGNVKNFAVVGGTISGFAHAVDWGNASGTMTVTGTVCGNITVGDFVIGTGCLVLDGIESEPIPGARFVTGATGNNPGSVICKGCSWQGATPADDYVILYTGEVILEGNQFFNGRTGTSYPRILINGEPRIGQPITSPCSLYSVGNWYQHHPGGIAPFYDGSNRLLLDPTGFYAGQAVQVVTLGDYGGIGGTLTRMNNYIVGK